MHLPCSQERNAHMQKQLFLPLCLKGIVCLNEIGWYCPAMLLALHAETVAAQDVQGICSWACLELWHVKHQFIRDTDAFCQPHYDVMSVYEDKQHAVTTLQLRLLSGSQRVCDVSSEVYAILAHQQPYTWRSYVCVYL